MKTAIAILAVLCLSGCQQRPVPPPPPPPASIYLASALDGTPLAPGSWHKAHVRILGPSFSPFRELILDDGSIVSVEFGGGTAPDEITGSGTLYAEVPYFMKNDDDNAYNFEKFTPDAPSSLMK